ncbi:MAG: DUF1735 domain-containing protein [Prolixibacteraceae bacterium]
MKKFIIIISLVVGFSSCYEDYVDDYDYDSIYFPYQIDVRTFVVGEGMAVKVGVSLGGTRENDRNREVRYLIDNSLVSPETLSAMKGGAAYIKNAVNAVTELKQLPANYYTVSDDQKFIIKKGEHSGLITLRPDSIKFLSDIATLTATYVLPLRITDGDADSVITAKNYAVIGLKYENMLFGNYWHGGITIEKDAQGTVVSTKKYYTTIPSPDSKAWSLTTVSPFSLVTNGVSELSSSSKPEFKITLNGEEIIIDQLDGATYEVLPDGESTYNQAKLLQDRKIFLNYKFQAANGNWCYARDTLTFRNRTRDGVNEWQDENPSKY